MRRSISFAVTLLLSCHVVVAQTTKAPLQKEPASLEQSETIAKEYLETFKKSGVPTPQAVAAAIAKAKAQPSVEAWTEVATIANAYANVVDVLKDHYSTLYYSSRSGGSGGVYDYISKAANYEGVRNRYLAMRNDAYIELAKLFAAKGEKAKALSFVVTAVKLSGSKPNTEGEALIKQLVEYAE